MEKLMGTGDLVCLFSGYCLMGVFFLCRRFRATSLISLLCILGWDVFGVLCLRKNNIKRVGKGSKIKGFLFSRQGLTVYICSSGCPGIHFVDQPGLKSNSQTSSCLCLPSAGIKGMCYHAQLKIKSSYLFLKCLKESKI